MSFENTRFIIVGAAGGIGSALSRRLKRLGAQPIVMGRTADKLAELGRELDAPTKTVDASNAVELEAAFVAFGPIQGIVNCVGSVLLKPAHLTSDSDGLKLYVLIDNRFSCGAIWLPAHDADRWVHRTLLDGGGADRFSES